MDTLTGRLRAGTDIGRLAPGDRVVVSVDGWTGEQLSLGLTEVRPFLARYPNKAWLYGIDPAKRVRQVLVRVEPHDRPVRLPC